MNANQEQTLPISADEELTRRIRNSLTSKRRELGCLKVRVDGGTVYLTGRLPSFHVRQIALVVAQHVAGVHNIVDDIVVQPQPTIRPRATST